MENELQLKQLKPLGLMQLPLELERLENELQLEQLETTEHWLLCNLHRPLLKRNVRTAWEGRPTFFAVCARKVLMTTYVIAYDISEDRRRERVAAVLLRFGRRIQFSVFVAELDSDEHRELRQALGPMLNELDSLEIFPIDTRDPDRWVSWRAEPSQHEPVIVIG